MASDETKVESAVSGGTDEGRSTAISARFWKAASVRGTGRSGHDHRAPRMTSSGAGGPEAKGQSGPGMDPQKTTSSRA